jgi:hypothetical protein
VGACGGSPDCADSSIRRLCFRFCYVDIVPGLEPWVLVLVGAVLVVGLQLRLRLRLPWWWRQRAAVEAKHRVGGLQTARHLDVESREWSGGGGRRTSYISSGGNYPHLRRLDAAWPVAASVSAREAI